MQVIICSLFLAEVMLFAGATTHFAYRVLIRRHTVPYTGPVESETCLHSTEHQSSGRNFERSIGVLPEVDT